jgi:hypothetical protein
MTLYPSFAAKEEHNIENHNNSTSASKGNKSVNPVNSKNKHYCPAIFKSNDRFEIDSIALFL